MAKKSNKTEQVLKLITKDSSIIEDLEGEEAEAGEVEDKKEEKTELVKEAEAEEVEAGQEPETEKAEVSEGLAAEELEVEVDVKEVEDKEHKIEAKLKVEIEPEIEIKKAEAPEKTYSNLDQNALQKEQDRYDENCGDGRCLVNLTERMVKEKVPEIMERLGVCTCSTCKLDVLALTLNSLPNKFITTDYGRLHLKLELYKKQYETDVVSAITKACVRVKVSPRHEE